MRRDPVEVRLRRRYEALAPLDAAVEAWRTPIWNAAAHRVACAEVRRVMPLLARALDRAVAQSDKERAGDQYVVDGEGE